MEAEKTEAYEINFNPMFLEVLSKLEPGLDKSKLVKLKLAVLNSNISNDYSLEIANCLTAIEASLSK